MKLRPGQVVRWEETRPLSSSPSLRDFEGDLISKKKKAEAILPYECNICRCPPIPNNAAHIERHKSGKKHRRLQELVEKKKVLEAWGIKLLEDANIKYICISCDLEMETNFEKMQQHFKIIHQLPLPTSMAPTLEVCKVYCRRTFYKHDYNFEEDKVNFLLVNGSISIEESNALSKNSIGILKRDLIPQSEIPELYRIASLLEERGKEIKQGQQIGGSRMVMYANCQLSWFSHPHAEMYALSETFIKKMSCYFQVAFPKVMTNFEKFLVNEGLSSRDGHFGGTLFTFFALTRDYNCLPHDGPTDYGFGIIVWLYPSGEVKLEDQPSFWLLQYRVHFHCANGGGFICNGNTKVHCTTSPKAVGVIGMAFVQKCPFIVELSKALKSPNEKLANNYFKAKQRYINQWDTNRGKGIGATFH